MNATERIAATIRAVREHRNMSARELSEETTNHGFHVTRNSITNLENGRKTTIAVHELLAIATALDVHPMDLINGTAANDPAPFRMTGLIASVEWVNEDDEMGRRPGTYLHVRLDPKHEDTRIRASRVTLTEEER